jgi:hypothetical protein
MVRAERARQLCLHGLRRSQGGVQPRALTRQRLIPFVLMFSWT